MADLAAQSLTYRPAAIRAPRRSFATGMLFAIPLSLALWGGIIWAAVSLL